MDVNKKGFTLLEILGVITILGFLVTMITVVVGGSLKQNKKNMVINSTKNYIEAVETYLAATALKDDLVKYEAGNVYNVNSETVIGDKTYPAINSVIEYTGDKVKEGTITTNDNYAVSSATLKINGMDVTYNGETKEATIK